jgi:alginate O-acetyltransferase complex protein AlgI
VIIADNVAAMADAAFRVGGESLSTGQAWLGIFAYTVQIYFDFSGYSDMAIGLGKMMGFTFPENFRHPYSAISMTDFWRRWHITLSNWFRDYVFIPLGGSTGSTKKTYRNLWAVFLLVGLWHGANWTFVVWGAYHGALLVIERATNQRPTGETASVAPLRRAIVLFFVIVGWVVFRAPNMSAALEYLRAMFSFGGEPSAAFAAAVTTSALIALAAGSVVYFLPRSAGLGTVLQHSQWRPMDIARVALVFLVFPYVAIQVAAGTFSPFLYFQF